MFITLRILADNAVFADRQRIVKGSRRMLWHLYRYLFLGISSFLRHGGPSVSYVHCHLYSGPCSGITTRREKEKIIGIEVRLRSLRAVFFFCWTIRIAFWLGWGRVYFCWWHRKVCSSTVWLTMLSEKSPQGCRPRIEQGTCLAAGRRAQLSTPPVLKINKEYIKDSQNGRKRNRNLMIAAFTCTLSICLYSSES